MKIATFQYKFSLFINNAEFFQLIDKQCQELASSGHNLILFPEFFGMMFLYSFPGNFISRTQKASEFLSDYIHFFQALAQKHQLYIQPGTLPLFENNQIYNRAYFFGPDQQVGYQDKIFLTPHEKLVNSYSCGSELKIFHTPFAKIAIAICYDCEFPSLTRKITSEGVKLILVPSYTDSIHGFHRVNISCQARALENQCYVALSGAIGQINVCDFLNDNAEGKAAIFGPIDYLFPDNGILAQCNDDETNYCSIELNFQSLDEIRTLGQTRNFADKQVFAEKINSMAIINIENF